MQKKNWCRMQVGAVAFILLFLCSGCTNQSLEEESTQGIHSENVLTEYSETEEETMLQDDVCLELADDVMVRILDYIPDMVIELKYATTDNFTGQIIYDNNEAYLRYGTVKKLMHAQEALKSRGYKLVLWDGYRPVAAQYKLWDICPDSRYVANPNNGFSKHSRGNTVDITIVTLDGQAVEMPTGFDDFTKEADREYSDVSQTAAQNSQMLEDIMTEAGFKGYQGEWWHYSDTTEYPIVE